MDPNQADHTLPTHPGTIILPDGYNGDFCECVCEPIEVDGDNYKLRVKNSYLIRWCTRQQWETTINQI